jgi:hypothetical protein
LDRCIRIPVDEEPGPELDEILHLAGGTPHLYVDTGHVSATWSARALSSNSPSRLTRRRP